MSKSYEFDISLEIEDVYVEVEAKERLEINYSDIVVESDRCRRLGIPYDFDSLGYADDFCVDGVLIRKIDTEDSLYDSYNKSINCSPSVEELFSEDFPRDDSYVSEKVEELNVEFVANNNSSALDVMPYTDDMIFDRESYMYEKTYKMLNVRCANRFLYEMYCYLNKIESQLGRNGYWSMVWRTLRLLIQYGKLEPYSNKRKIVRKCSDYRYQQFMNLVSMIYSWQCVYSYPYVEEVQVGGTNGIEFIVKFPYIPTDEKGSLRFLVQSQALNVESWFDVNLFEYMINPTVSYLINVMLVSKSCYVMVYRFLFPMLNTYKYLNHYAFGQGIRDIDIIPNVHTNARTHGSFVRKGFIHDHEECEDCYRATDSITLVDSEMAIDDYLDEMEVSLGVTIQITPFLYSMMGASMGEIKSQEIMKYVANLPTLETGVLINIIELLTRQSDRSKDANEVFDFYYSSYAFYIARAFVPESISFEWCAWMKGMFHTHRSMIQL